MNKKVAYLSIGIAGAGIGIGVAAAVTEVPKLFAQAIERAVSERVQQMDHTPKTVRVGGGGS